MYTLSNLRKALENPEWFVREGLRLVNHTRAGCDYNPDGIDIFEEDWDNLIILDACRYDEFATTADLEGSVTKTISRGATSSEFIRGNFRNKRLHDTVYVTANGFFALLMDQIDSEVHDLVSLHTPEYRGAVDGRGTEPEIVTDHLLEANREYPNKRLIAHYLQPHQPYLSDWARDRITHAKGLAETVKKNNLTQDELRRAYRENLELILAEVDIVLPQLEGKTVVTADHGELLGERPTFLPLRDYGHWDGVHVPELVEVPWHVVENGDRKEIVSESPKLNSVQIDQVEDHLKDLGYKV